MNTKPERSSAYYCIGMSRETGRCEPLDRNSHGSRCHRGMNRVTVEMDASFDQDGRVFPWPCFKKQGYAARCLHSQAFFASARLDGRDVMSMEV